MNTKLIFTAFSILLFTFFSCNPPENSSSNNIETVEPVNENAQSDSSEQVVSTYSPYNINPMYNELDSCENTNFTYDEFKVTTTDIGQRYFTNNKEEYYPPPAQDDNGVYMYNLSGKLVYHPVAMAEYSQNLIDIYFRTKDEKCLKYLEAHARKFIGIGVEIDNTYLFPYVFNYNFNSRDMMTAPWYTAMAQGEILSVFSKLYEITGNQHYRETASRIFKSFSRHKGKYEQWISCIDQEGNLWLEEYPNEKPSHVLNGMIFAIFGIYDYYLINKGDEELKMLKAAITTIKKNIKHYRNENDMSYYCLKYTALNPNYHPIHIRQLRMLHTISGIKEFKDMADLLEQDAAAKLKAEVES